MHSPGRGLRSVFQPRPHFSDKRHHLLICNYSRHCIFAFFAYLMLRPRSICIVHQSRAFFLTRSVRTRTGLTKPPNLPAWKFGRGIFNRLAKPCVSLARIVFRLNVNLDLELGFQTRWFLWLEIFLDLRQLWCYYFTALVSGIQTEAIRITKLLWDQCESNRA